jgi:hypothetical protein
MGRQRAPSHDRLFAGLLGPTGYRRPGDRVTGEQGIAGPELQPDAATRTEPYGSG